MNRFFRETQRSIAGLLLAVPAGLKANRRIWRRADMVVALSPNKARVVFDSVLFQEAQELLLEGLLFVMVRLVFDVVGGRVDAGDADAEGPVALLPGEGNPVLCADEM